MLFDIPDVTAPILMAPHRFERHFQLGAPLALWLPKSVELPICGHDAATGCRTHLEPLPQACGMDTIFTQQRILLEFADLVSDLERHFAYPLVGLWLRI